jgi:hypothetical protein
MKDSYWFKHDSSASRDIKLMKIKHIYDFWGIGLYWSVVEVLREQPEYKFDSSESGLNLVSDLVYCSDKIKFINWFNDCLKVNLFKIENNCFYSSSLCERMGKWETKKLNGSKGGKPVKTEYKPKRKPKLKANDNHKIREDKIREDKKEFQTQIKNEFPDPTNWEKEELNKFYSYWTEPNKSNTKLKFQMEKTWDLKRRVNYWFDNAEKFDAKYEKK